MEPLVGKKFKYTIGGSRFDAEILDIQDVYVIVLINNKKLKIRKKYLVSGKFAEEELEKDNKKKEQIYRKNEKHIKKTTKTTKTPKIIKQCRNCMEYKNGNCIGENEICEFFRNAPEISNEELERWPKYGQASKMKNNNSIIREYDWMYDKYNEYH